MPMANFTSSFYLYNMTGVAIGVYLVTVRHGVAPLSVRVFESTTNTVQFGFSPNPSQDMQTNVAKLGR